MLSQTTEYALRSIVWLAANGNQPRTTRQIAAAAHIPGGYLSKVMQMLVDAGIVISQRGRGGGFVLARPASAITVLEVVDAVDPIRRIETCPLKLREHAGQLCALHRHLDEALAMIRQAFAACTLADLLEGKGAPPLCEDRTKAPPAAAYGNLAGRSRRS